jgi:FkbM family methyltransferase
MLTRDEVIWGFRYLLGRDPESEDTILAHTVFRDWAHLREALLKTEEFANAVRMAPINKRWVLAPVMNGARLMWVDLGDRYVSRGCLVDNYEPIETAFVRRHLRSDSIFLDVGANIGWFTIVASTIVGERGRIHAFEPLPDTAAHLKQTIEANELEALVTVHELALSATDGEGFINWSKGTDNPGGSFATTQLMNGFESVRIAFRTLDSLALGRVDFVKLDVEGSEMNVMRGGEKTILGSRPVMLAEVNPTSLRNISGVSPDELIDYVRGHGYRVVMLDHERGEFEIDRFPPDWPRELANVGMLPIPQ